MRNLAQHISTALELADENAQRVRAEKRVKHLNAVLRAIRNVNQLIAREKDRDRLLPGVCGSLIRHEVITTSGSPSWMNPGR